MLADAALESRCGLFTLRSIHAAVDSRMNTSMRECMAPVEAVGTPARVARSGDLDGALDVATMGVEPEASVLMILAEELETEVS